MSQSLQRKHAVVVTLLVVLPVSAQEESIALQPIVVSSSIVSTDALLDNNLSLSNVTLNEDAMRHERRATLGETIARQPGLQMESYGAASAKPVIRAYNSERVSVFNDGLSANGASAISTNYPLGLLSNNIESIKVVKTGAATRYGGNAIGGAISSNDGLIPSAMHEKPFGGSINIGGGMNAPLAQGATLKVNVGDNWAWQVQAGWQSRDHVAIPGNNKAAVCSDTDTMAHNGIAQHFCQVFVERYTQQNPAWYPFIKKEFVDHPDQITPDKFIYTTEQWGYLSEPPYFYQNLPNPEFDPAVNQDPDPQKAYIVNYAEPRHNVANLEGEIPNSHASQKYVALGNTYFGDNWQISTAFRHQDQFYGVPGFAFMLTKTDADPYANIDVKGRRNQWQISGEMAFSGFIDRAQFSVAHTREHTNELLGSISATQLDNRINELHLSVNHSYGEHWRGQWGIDATRSQLQTSGADRYLPNVDYKQRGLFLLQQYQHPWFSAEVGYRREWVNYDPDISGYTPSRNSTPVFDARRFKLNQYHADILLTPTEHWALGYSFAHGERAPSANALYGSNAHMAILSIESGDPHLEAEKALTHEISTSYDLDPATLKLSYYHTDYKNYISLGYRGLNVKGNSVRQWQQSDYTIRGWEGELTVNWNDTASGNWQWRLFGDLVRSKINEPDERFENGNGAALPLSRYGTTLDWYKGPWAANLSVTHYLKPRKLGAQYNVELPLPSYTLVDGRISYQWDRGDARTLSVFVEGQNLTNSEARAHNSPVKYLSPLPGRSLFFGLNYQF